MNEAGGGAVAMPAHAPVRDPAGHGRTAVLVGMAAVLATGLAARLYGIDAKPFWMDEITTLQRASLPLRQVIADSLSFHHLPAYFLVVSWLKLIGASEAVLRLPSAVFGALTGAVVCGIGRTLAGLRAGVLAGLLVALSPLQVQYGQEARSYALVICLIAVALWGLVALAQDPGAAARPLRDPGAARGAWAAYGLGTLGALNVLGVALFWLLAATLASVAIGARRGLDRRQFLRNWLMVHGAIAPLSAPWFVAMYAATRSHLTEGLDWVPALSLGRLWSTIAAVYLMRHSSLISLRLLADGVPLLALPVAGLALLGLVRLWRRRTAFAVMAIAWLTLPLGLLAISTALSLWLPRYVLWSAIPFFVLAGCGLAALPRHWQMPAAAAVVTAALANLVPYYDEETKPRWDLAAAELLAGLQENDLVLVDDPWAVKLMNVYLERSGADLLPGDWTDDRAAARARLDDGGQVWAVHGRVGQVDKESMAEFRDSLAPLGEPAAAIRAGAEVVVFRFAPPPKERCPAGAQGDCGRT
jgi:predicted membrane-bound mannosyltransferase